MAERRSKTTGPFGRGVPCLLLGGPRQGTLEADRWCPHDDRSAYVRAAADASNLEHLLDDALETRSDHAAYQRGGLDLKRTITVRSRTRWSWSTSCSAPNQRYVDGFGSRISNRTKR